MLLSTLLIIAFCLTDLNIVSVLQARPSLGFSTTLLVAVSLLSWATITQQQYADNTQLYIALSPNDSCTSVVNLESCLNDLYYWCCLNGLALNPDKTDSILLGTRQQANSYKDIATVKVADTSAVLKNKIKILGVTLDKSPYHG